MYMYFAHKSVENLLEMKYSGIYHMHVQNVVGFNKQVEESKGKAQDAIQKIPDIENLIKRAENKTQEARDALSGAESDANEALSLAQLAQVTATNASMVSCFLLYAKKLICQHV